MKFILFDTNIYIYFKAYRTYAQVFDIPTSYNDDIIDNEI